MNQDDNLTVSLMIILKHRLERRKMGNEKLTLSDRVRSSDVPNLLRKR